MTRRFPATSALHSGPWSPDSVVARLGRLRPRRLSGEGPRAAVLVPLCEVDGQASVLLTKRSETVGTHKGHVSFPGGMCDPGDRDASDTALRECEEELGLPREGVRVLGAFHEARAITGVRVTPVMAYLGALDVSALAPSAQEIDDVFTLLVAQLVDPQHVYWQDYGARGTLPVFDAGPHPVWGLTAYILAGVLEEVLGLPLPADAPVVAGPALRRRDGAP